jgi:transposase
LGWLRSGTVANPVRDVAERLGVSIKSTYTWQKQFSWSAKMNKDVDPQADGISRPKRDLARVTEERGILKWRPHASPGKTRSRGCRHALPCSG